MNNKDTVIILLGPLETLNNFARDAGKGLEQNNIHCILFQMTCDDLIDSSNILNLCKNNNVIAALTLNNLGLNITYSEQNLWDVLNIKLFNWLVDHPINYLHNYDSIPDNTVFLCVDKTHVEFLNIYFPEIECYFLPHAGTISEKEIAGFEDREFDICYFGTVKYDINNPDQYISKRMNSDPFFLKIAEYYLDNPNQISYHEAFEYMLKKVGANIDNRKDLLQLMSVYYFAWDFGITYYRQYLIKALAKSGLKVHVFGNNWEEIVKDVDNVTYHGLITPSECIEYMGKTKIVLNNMPGFINGSHERVFNSMLEGAVCCSNHSRYLSEQFEDNKSILFYEEKNIQKVLYDLRKIINDKYSWQAISQAGLNKCLEKHTFSKRMEELIRIIKNK